MVQEKGHIISCRSRDTWNQQLRKGNDSNELMVVYFTDLWCGPCRLISPFLADLAMKLTDVMFIKVDVDELQSVAKDFTVDVMPTFVFLKQGKVVNRVVGVKKEELQATITRHMN